MTTTTQIEIARRDGCTATVVVTYQAKWSAVRFTIEVNLISRRSPPSIFRVETIHADGSADTLGHRDVPAALKAEAKKAARKATR